MSSFTLQHSRFERRPQDQGKGIFFLTLGHDTAVVGSVKALAEAVEGVRASLVSLEAWRPGWRRSAGQQRDGGALAGSPAGQYECQVRN